MKWIELSVGAPSEFVEPLSQVFQRCGRGGIVIEEEGGFDADAVESPAPARWVILKTYLPLSASYRSRREMIDVSIRLISLLHPLDGPHEREIEEKEWENAWKAHFTLLRIGKRTVIKPSWEAYAPKDGEVVIELDPGMAFGTGHHPTTRMCLEELETLVRPGDRVLDLGTGSGILAIAAAKLGAAQVMALEVDALAAKVARQNVRANGVVLAVRVLQGTLPHPRAEPGGFPLVVANINAKIVAQLASRIGESLAPHGLLVASGIIQEHRGLAESALTSVGLELTRFRQDGDWLTLVLQKR